MTFAENQRTLCTQNPNSLNLYNGISGEGERLHFHQPKQAVPEHAENQTLKTPAAAHRVQWGAPAVEGHVGAAEQPQLVGLVSFSEIEVFNVAPCSAKDLGGFYE